MAVATPHHTAWATVTRFARSQRLLDSLNLVLMEDGGDYISSDESPRSQESQESAATTVTCSTEGPLCITP